MGDVEIAVKVPDSAHQHARAFLEFLQRAARKHSVLIRLSTLRPGAFNCVISGKDTQKFELFLQELMFNQGLYYYLCSIPNRREVARSVVVPIFREFLELSFAVIYPSLIRRHVLEGAAGWILAGDFTEGLARQYERLFRQCKLKMISGYEFIRDVDDLLTEWMLWQLEYKKGQKSPKFNLLVGECVKKEILRGKEICQLFDRVHSLRTRGLHRSEKEIPDAEVSQLAIRVFFFFEYLEDYFRAQDEKTIKLSGKRYRRIRWGDEIRRNWSMPKGYEVTWAEVIKKPCGDCGVILGELHLEGCDIEVCPSRGGQYLCCECRRDDYEKEDAYDAEPTENDFPQLRLKLT